MAGKSYSQDEQAFMADLGLADDANLELLVADAAPLEPDVAERIRQASRRKAAGGHSETQTTSPGPAARPNRRRFLIAAAAVLLGLTTALAATHPEAAMAAVKRIFHLIPGMGIQETSQQTLVMAQPVQVTAGGRDLTVTGLVSDGRATHITFRIAGIPQTKAFADGRLYDQNQFGLVLPDSTRLEMSGAQVAVGADITAGVWFPPLPSGTQTVTLLVPAMTGLSDPFTVQIPVADVASANLPEAKAGGWAAEQHGVRIGAPDIAFSGEEITVRVQGVTADPKAQVTQIATYHLEMERFSPTLTDDLGTTYPRNPAADTNPGGPDEVSLAFTGPVAPDAATLTLTVPAVEVTQQAEATLHIDLTDLPVGASKELQQEVKLGQHTVTLRKATRETAGDLLLDLDLGPEVDGVQLLHFGLEPIGRPISGFSWGWEANEETWQMRNLNVEVLDGARTVSLRLNQPVVRVRGPWTVELPAR